MCVDDCYRYGGFLPGKGTMRDITKAETVMLCIRLSSILRIQYTIYTHAYAQLLYKYYIYNFNFNFKFIIYHYYIICVSAKM